MRIRTDPAHSGLYNRLPGIFRQRRRPTVDLPTPNAPLIIMIIVRVSRALSVSADSRFFALISVGSWFPFLNSLTWADLTFDLGI